MPTRRAALAAVIAGLVCVLLAAWRQDVTYDEPSHLGWSRRLWDQGVTERQSSLLYNSKTPVTLLNVVTEKAAAGAGFGSERGQIVAARLPGLFWFALTAALTWALARRLAGEWAGAAAAALVALDPSLAANASVTTVDVPFAAASLLVLLAALRFGEDPRGGGAVLLGAALGLAFAAKYTAFLLLPAGLAGLVAGGLKLRRRDALLAGLAAAVAGLVVVGVSYLAVGLFEPLGSLTLRSPLMRGFVARAPWLRLPLPADFVTGFDILLDQERTHDWNVILLGREHAGGVWYYFLVCWLLKTPLATLPFLLVGLALAARRLRSWTALFVAGNLALFLGFLSFRLQAQLGHRLALMVLPLAAALGAAGWSLGAAPRLRERALAAALVLSAAEGLPYVGNSLAFTNALVLPKRDAFRYLAGANLDWGQNDEKVVKWLETSGPRPASLEPALLRPGWNVLSVNSLAGISSPRRFRWAREHLEPLGHFRHTYVWFFLDPGAYARFLAEDRLLPEDTDGRCERPDAVALPAGEWAALPRSLATWLVCVAGEAAFDLSLEGRRGSALVGQPDRHRRDWEQLRLGEPLVYRAGTGRRFLLVRPGGDVELRLTPGAAARLGAVLLEEGELGSGPKRRRRPRS
ncbi:MAG TPA: glycosyltransferase family 39 protein [Vicinamibacteria bacterium]|nr:glycosyltransferase family 39 protein [Vicinamibacteria bacterium]